MNLRQVTDKLATMWILALIPNVSWKSNSWPPLQWNAVALWAWDIVVDNCAICRNHIMDLCKYEGLVKSGGSSGLTPMCDILTYLPLRYRVPGESGLRDVRRVHSCVGRLQCKKTCLLLFTLSSSSYGQYHGETFANCMKLLRSGQSTKINT